MTSNPLGNISIDKLLSDLLTKEGSFPSMFTSTTVTTESTEPEDGPKYKKVSNLSIGTKVVLPSGDVDTVINLGRVNDDLIEIVFAESDDVEMWKNAMLEVK